MAAAGWGDGNEGALGQCGQIWKLALHILANARAPLQNSASQLPRSTKIQLRHPNPKPTCAWSMEEAAPSVPGFNSWPAGCGGKWKWGGRHEQWCEGGRHRPASMQPNRLAVLFSSTPGWFGNLASCLLCSSPQLSPHAPPPINHPPPCYPSGPAGHPPCWRPAPCTSAGGDGERY